jgi:DNA-binding protein HU-beta/integration host factor subunit beta
LWGLTFFDLGDLKMAENSVRTKRDIIAQITHDFHVDTSQARKMVQAVLNGIVNATLDHGRIEIRRFGTFKILHRAARVARNPRTNEELRLPPRYVVTFEPSDQLSAKVVKKFGAEELVGVGADKKEHYDFSISGSQSSEFSQTT